jgi:hypothetical protein
MSFIQQALVDPIPHISLKVYIVYSVHCREPIHNAQTKEMHNTVPQIFILQNYIEYSYTFRFPRDHHQGIKSTGEHNPLYQLT